MVRTGDQAEDKVSRQMAPCSIVNIESHFLKGQNLQSDC